MATGDTTITSMGDSVPAELMAATILEAARAAIVATPMAALDFFGGSNVKSFPRFDKVTAGLLTEGTDGTFTTMTDTQVSCTLGEIGIGVRMTDKLEATSSLATIERIANELGKGFADKVDADILAAAASLTDNVGTTTSALTEDQFFQAIYECDANDIGGRTLAAILYPKQAHHLTIAIAGTTENNSVVWGRPEILNQLAPSAPNGYKFTVAGVDVFQSTNVTTANTGEDSVGMLIVPGPDCPFTLGVGIWRGSPWFARMERQRDASFRGEEVWVTGLYGVAVTAAERGCRITTDR